MVGVAVNGGQPARPTLAERLDGPLGTLLAPIGWLWDGTARLRARAYQHGSLTSHRPRFFSEFQEQLRVLL